VTQSILELLVKKANKGVEVKLLIDAFGSQGLEFSPAVLKALKDAGGENITFLCHC